jgi:Plavaka transposase
MLWSDSTHLASFGNASLWPVYLYLGNLLKYWCAKPSSFATHHLAYLPSVCICESGPSYTYDIIQLPDTVQDAYTKVFGKSASVGTLTFLKCDLMQSIWMLLLDNDFIHTYTHGLETKCVNGIVRQIYPRLFTYSADYPEK